MGGTSTSCVAQMALIARGQHVTNESGESPNTIQDISGDSPRPDLSCSCFRNGSRESPTQTPLNDKSKVGLAQKRNRSCAATSRRFRVSHGAGGHIHRDAALGELFKMSKGKVAKDRTSDVHGAHSALILRRPRNAAVSKDG